MKKGKEVMVRFYSVIQKTECDMFSPANLCFWEENSQRRVELKLDTGKNSSALTDSYSSCPNSLNFIKKRTVPLLYFTTKARL